MNLFNGLPLILSFNKPMLYLGLTKKEVFQISKAGAWFIGSVLVHKKGKFTSTRDIY